MQSPSKVTSEVKRSANGSLLLHAKYSNLAHVKYTDTDLDKLFFSSAHANMPRTNNLNRNRPAPAPKSRPTSYNGYGVTTLPAHPKEVCNGAIPIVKCTQNDTISRTRRPRRRSLPILAPTSSPSPSTPRYAFAQWTQMHIN
jgi:hypothetical protein